MTTFTHNILYLALFVAILTARGLADTQSFDNTTSAKGLCVVQLIPHDPASIKFFDSNRRKALGALFDKKAPDVNNVLCSWSPNEDKAAILYYYGTKLSEIALYQRGDSGFNSISLDLPSVENLFRNTGKQTLNLRKMGRRRTAPSGLGWTMTRSKLLLVTCMTRAVRRQTPNRLRPS